MTMPVIIASTRKRHSPPCPCQFREACWNVGATKLANHLAHRAAKLHQRHPHWRDPASLPHRRRDSTHHIHRRGLLPQNRRGRTSSPTASATSAWRSRCTFSPSPHRSRTRHTRCPSPSPRCSSALVLLRESHRHPLPLMATLSQKMVTPMTAAPATQSRSHATSVCSYGKNEVIHGINFHIEPNEIFGIIGPAQSRQDLAPSLHQSHHRIYRRHARRRQHPRGRRGHRENAQRL